MCVLMFVSETSLPRQIKEVGKFVTFDCQFGSTDFWVKSVFVFAFVFAYLQGWCLCRSKVACIQVTQPFLPLSVFYSRGVGGSGRFRVSGISILPFTLGHLTPPNPSSCVFLVLLYLLDCFSVFHQRKDVAVAVGNCQCGFGLYVCDV